MSRTDRFGNRIDPAVSCARRSFLASEVDETLRQRHGYALIRERFQRLEKAPIDHRALIARLPLRGEDPAAVGRRTQELVDAFQTLHYTADQSG